MSSVPPNPYPHATTERTCQHEEDSKTSAQSRTRSADRTRWETTWALLRSSPSPWTNFLLLTYANLLPSLWRGHCPTAQNRIQLYSNRYSNPQRLRPPRWTSQMLNATEATTTMLSRMAVVIALIYR